MLSDQNVSEKVLQVFDNYELGAVLAPGLLSLVAVALGVPNMRSEFLSKDLSFGGLGLVLALAYATGHLLQAAGNALEWLWWKAWRGDPSDWVRTGAHTIVSDAQRHAFLAGLGCPPGAEPSGASPSEAAWAALTRQAAAKVRAAARGQRLDAFNRSLGANRGFAVSALVAAAACLTTDSCPAWVAITLFACAAACWARMHRYSRNYTRELVGQYLECTTAVPPSPAPTAA